MVGDLVVPELDLEVVVDQGLEQDLEQDLMGLVVCQKTKIGLIHHTLLHLDDHRVRR